MITLNDSNNTFILDLLPTVNCSGFIFIFTNVFNNKYSIAYIEPIYTGRTFYFDLEVGVDNGANAQILLSDYGQYYYNVYECFDPEEVDNEYLEEFLQTKITQLEWIKSDTNALRTGRMLYKNIN